MDSGFANNQANASTSNWVHLNYDLGHGSGSGDMVVYIPNSLFVGGSFVYLYSAFGSNFSSGDGFEEWWVNKSSGGGGGGQGQVPEPASLALIGSGLSLMVWRLRKQRAI